MQQQAHGGNIGNGIHGSHLVKVDVLHGNTVNVAFRLGDFLVNRQNVQLHHGGDGQAADDAADVAQAAVMVMMAGFLFLTVNRHFHMSSGNAAFFALFRRKLHAGNAQSVEFFYKPGFIRQKLQQGRGEHIPGGAHAAVQVQRLHFLTSI